MCGISCSITLRGYGPAARHGDKKNRQEATALAREGISDQLEKSLEIIKHRGPDDRGYWISDDCRVGKASCTKSRAKSD